MDAVKKAEAKLLFESLGVKPQAIADRFGVSRTIIDRMIVDENWKEPRPGVVDSAAKAAALMKLEGKQVRVSDMDKDAMREMEKKLAREAADVLALHRNDWEQHRQVFGSCVFSDIEQAKAAKMSAEAIMVRQKGERETYEITTNKRPMDTIEEQLKKLAGETQSVTLQTLTMEMRDERVIEGEQT